MPLSPFRKLLGGLFSIIGVLCALVGIVLLLSGYNAYQNPSATDVHPFEQILFATGFIGLPVTGLLYYRARMSFLRGMNRYGLPDAPSQSLFLSVLAIGAMILTCAAFIIVFTVF
jgi:hypothetical protein